MSVTQPKPFRLFLLLLGIIAFAGVWLIKITTPNGMGLTDDAISYIAAARALLNGQGFTRIWLASRIKPITHWPPLFSATIAAAGMVTHRDPARAARFVNALLFGGNAFLLGLLGWKMTRRYTGGLLLAVLFLFNPMLLTRHVYALSEPLYIFFTLLSLLALAWGLEKESSNRRAILLAGIFSGLAYLTRYAALSLLATLSLLLLLFPRSWKERFRALGLYWAGTLPWVLSWMLRNEIVGGSATNRALQWHPPSIETLREGAYTFLRFIVPFPKLQLSLIKHPLWMYALLGALGAGIIGWVLLHGIRLFWKMKDAPRPNPLAYASALYFVVYMGALLVSISLFDAATPLNDRILSPMFVSLLTLLVCAAFPRADETGYPQTGAASPRNGIRFPLRALAVFFLSALLLYLPSAERQTVQQFQESAPGFASWRWQNSEVMALLRELPEGTLIYTNQPPAVYFWTNHPAMPFFPEDLSQAEDIHEQVLDGKAVVALWNTNDIKASRYDEFLKILLDGLPARQKTGLGDLYGTLP